MVTLNTPRRIEGAGTSESAWLGWDGVSAAPLRSLDDWLSADQRLVVVAPHPDDEILAGGALAALHAERGGEVQVIAVTDGEASHRGCPDCDPERLAAERRHESAVGLERLLGRAPVPLRLNLPDSAVAPHVDALRTALTRALRPADVVVTTWRLDGHPDHEACGDAAAAVCEAAGCVLLEAPVWMWHWAAPADPRVPWARLRGLPVPPEASARRRAAIDAHTTQLTRRGAEGPVLTPAILQRLARRVEHFFVESRSA